MDTYEATKTVLSRVKSLDPDNASKITGYILIQDQGEKEMIRLAFSPESVLVSYVNQAKACLGISSSTCSAPSSTPSSPSPFGHTGLNRHNSFSQLSPRIVIPNTRFHFNNNPSSPSSPWSSSRSPASYAAVVNNGSNNNGSGSSSSSLSLPFYGNNSNNNNNNCGNGDFSDEIGNIPVQDQLSFLDESSLDHPIVSPSGRSDSVVYPYGNCEENTVLHRRSCSVNDAFLGGGEDGGNMGLGWRPCLYYSRGFCKNGDTCKFLHHGCEFGPVAGDTPPPPDCVAPGPHVGPGSPVNNIDGFDELLKLKALQHQRFAQQLMASGAPPPPPPPFAYNKCMNFLNDSQRSALMMGDDFNKFNRFRRTDYSNLGLGGSESSASRQIYLTFPADSTFKEEDVSNYFGIYGPVQDVRIPYQQKRMFGFVTFVHPETVKLILAKGNPHFVCDSRVLVKPYKEKGKVPDKKQHLERGDFSGCLSPSGFDSRELYDIPFGARMFYNNQEMMLRRKLEQEVELKQAMEIQGRRLMNLQLMDLKTHQHQHHMFPGVPFPRHPQSPFSHNHFFPSDFINPNIHEDSNCDSNAATSVEVTEDSMADNNNIDKNKEERSNIDKSDQQESLENSLPDNLFASPTKSCDDNSKTTSTSSSNLMQIRPNTSNLGLSSLKSSCFEIPRFSSGQETAEI